MIFEAAAEPPTVDRPHPPALRRRLQRCADVAALVTAQCRRRPAHLFDRRRVMGPGARHRARWCGGSPPRPRAAGLGALTHAMRHVGRVGRPVGGSGQVPLALLAAFEHPAGRCAPRVPSTRSPAPGTGSAASPSSTAPRSRHRSSCRRATPTTRSCRGCAIRRRRQRARAPLARTPATTRATNPRSTPCCRQRPCSAASTGRSGRPRRSRPASPRSTAAPA
jgi:hypothetical protein